MMGTTDVNEISQALLDQGQKLKQGGNLEQAIAIYQEAIHLNPGCWEAHHFLGEILAQKNELDGAIKSYQQALKLNPENHWSHHCLGQALSWLGNLDQAVVCATRSIELKPDQAEFSASLGLYSALQGNAQQAIAYYQKALGLNPSLPADTYLSLINLMWEQKLVKDGISYCTEAIKHHPHCAEIYFHQGKFLAIQELWRDAVLSYGKALEIQPNYWQAYEALGNVYSKLNQLDKAAQAHQRGEKEFYQVQEFSPGDLPGDFDWEIYLIFNSELKITSRLQAIAHFLNYGLKENKLYSFKHLHDPVKKPDIAPLSVILPGKRAVIANSINSTRPRRLGVLVHIYYFDLWLELSSYIKNIPGEFDLYINIVASIWYPQIDQQIHQDFPQAQIIVSANQGKDIGGHLASMAHLDFNQYNLFCLLHTKKSPHIDPRISDIWRKDLYDALLGSKEKAAQNLAIMNQYAQVGLIGSRYWRCTMMGNNWGNYTRLLREFKIKPEAQDCEYLSGTMMLVRSQIMQTIYHHFGDVELENGDGQELSFHVDGQVAHAIERLIGNLVRDRGLEFFWQE